MDARLNARKVYIDGRDRDQTAREEALNFREENLKNQQATYDALKLQVDKLQAQSHEDDIDVPACPYPQCATEIMKMARSELVEHLKKHASDEGTTFTCPLERADGSPCARHISLKEGGFDLTIHYEHKVSDDEQAAVNSTVSSMGNEFKKLRAKIQAAQPQLTSDIDFLQDRSEMLGQVAAASPPTHLHAPPPKPPASSLTVDNDPNLPKIGEQTPDYAPTRSSASRARAGLRATRRRRPSISLQEYKDLGVDDTTSISSGEHEEIVSVSIKRTVRPSKTTAAKPAPVASKKRKQADIEEEVVSTRKALHKASTQSPEKKKQKKTGDAATVALPPTRANINLTATPVKKVRRPKAKGREDEEEGGVMAGAMRPPLKRVTKTPASK
jgi:hypothetical protein